MSAIDRELPFSEDAERALLGSMLLDERAVAEVIGELRQLGSEVFHLERHRLLFEQVVALYDANQGADGLMLKDHLRRQGLLDAVGGMQYLGELIAAVPSPERAKGYAEIVRDKYLLRQLIRVSHNSLESAYDAKRPVADILDDAERALFSVTERRINEGASQLPDLVDDVLRMLRERGDEPLLGEPTGFFELDSLTTGLQPSELIIVAGRPSMGKTAFGLNIAEHMAIVERRPVLFFSLEMSKRQLAQRILCSRGRVDAQRFRHGTLRAEELQQLEAAAEEMREAPLLVDETTDLGVLELRARARLAFRRYHFRAIFVDYLQLMRGPKSESRQVEVAEISRGLKSLAKELQVPVVALAQLNRGPEDRAGNRPRMSDLRESGAIEQDADVIMLLHRESYYREDGETEGDQNTADVIIAKQRNGPVGTITLHFNKQWTRFDNHSHRDFVGGVSEIPVDGPF